MYYSNHVISPSVDTTPQDSVLNSSHTDRENDFFRQNKRIRYSPPTGPVETMEFKSPHNSDFGANHWNLVGTRETSYHMNSPMCTTSSANNSRGNRRGKKRYFSDLSANNSHFAGVSEGCRTPSFSRPKPKDVFYRVTYKDISEYYDPTCMDDPWAEFEE